MLECKVCGRKLRQINGSHLKSHSMTSEEYKKQFPGSILIPHFVEMNKSTEFRKFISDNSKGKPKSEEHKLALREAKANEDKEHRAKVNGDNRRGKKHTRETIEHIAKHSGANNPYKGKSGTRADLGHFVRSTWEANMARIYKLKGTPYEFEPKIFWLTKEDGSEVSYRPDFYLPNENLYIEVKGYWYEDAKEKYELFLQQYPNEKILVIESEQYEIYKKQFKSLIPEWE